MKNFQGKWITDKKFEELVLRRVFYRQLERPTFTVDENANSHILFRQEICLIECKKGKNLYYG